MSEQRVTVRLESDTLALLQSLVDDGTFPTLADAVVTAVDDLIEAHLTPERAEQVLSDPSGVPYIDIDAITVGGAGITADEIRDSVSAYVEQHRGLRFG